jgi:hypothetical protein
MWSAAWTMPAGGQRAGEDVLAVAERQLRRSWPSSARQSKNTARTGTRAITAAMSRGLFSSMRFCSRTEARPSRLVVGDDLAVQDHVRNRKRADRFRDLGIARGDVLAAAAEHLHLVTPALGDDAHAVVLDLEQPVPCA